jgi:hypothetical protein
MEFRFGPSAIPMTAPTLRNGTRFKPLCVGIFRSRFTFMKNVYRVWLHTLCELPGPRRGVVRFSWFWKPIP